MANSVKVRESFRLIYVILYINHDKAQSGLISATEIPNNDYKGKGLNSSKFGKTFGIY